MARRTTLIYPAESRYLFLEAVASVAPEVLQDLGGEPLGAFQKVADALANPEDCGQIKDLEAESSGTIKAWQMRWGLSAAWIFDVAEELLGDWLDSPEEAGTLTISIACSRPGELLEFPFDLPHPGSWTWIGWHPERESRAGARARLVEWATERIDDYLERGEVAVKAAGFSDHREAARHYEWAALYLFGRNKGGGRGMPYRELADQLGVPEKTLAEQIPILLDELDLPRQLQRRGRKPGIRERTSRNEPKGRRAPRAKPPE